MTLTLEQIAEALWQAEHSGTPRAPLRDALDAVAAASSGSMDALAAAYAVQNINTQRRLATGERLVGRKIGLTSLAVQQQLGVGSPDFGALFASMAVGHGEEIAASRLMQPKVEAEIALVLERDLNHSCHTVADNASSGLFVLGSRPVKLSKFDLINCGMVMERRGDQVSLGLGAACLGNPLNAAVWLANMMVRVGSPLRAGDVLMTGALGPMVAVQPGDVFSAQIEGLGAVSAVFSHAA